MIFKNDISALVSVPDDPYFFLTLKKKSFIERSWYSVGFGRIRILWLGSLSRENLFQVNKSIQ